MNETSQIKEAIRLALDGQWDAAHQIVQGIDTAHAAWVHAILHKVEGDRANSEYWYRRAKRPFSNLDPASEYKAVLEALGDSAS
jgi:hypothetical protein